MLAKRSHWPAVLSSLTLWVLGCSESHDADIAVISWHDMIPEDPISCGLVQIAAVSGELGGPFAMAQDEERLYFDMPKDKNSRQETETWSVSKTGGALTLASGTTSGFPLPEETEVAGIRYRLSADQRAITRDTGGGEAETITPLPAEMAEECFAIGADETSLYFTSEEGELWRAAAVPGAAPERLFETGRTDCDDDYHGLMLAVDQTYVYWLGGKGYSWEGKTSDGEPLGLFRACK